MNEEKPLHEDGTILGLINYPRREDKDFHRKALEDNYRKSMIVLLEALIELISCQDHGEQKTMGWLTGGTIEEFARDFIAYFNKPDALNRCKVTQAFEYLKKAILNPK